MAKYWSTSGSSILARQFGTELGACRECHGTGYKDGHEGPCTCGAGEAGCFQCTDGVRDDGSLCGCHRGEELEREARAYLAR